MLLRFTILIICLLWGTSIEAQDTSALDRNNINRLEVREGGSINRDSSKEKKVFQPNAKKAGMYSSILPGLGQAYNRQYWKVPVVYAILGTAGYFIGYNYQQYAEYRQAYIQKIDGDPSTNTKEQYALYDASDLQRLQNSYKKDLDIIVLLTSVGYALQIMDAVASAHLKNFDMSTDISLQMKPVIQSNFIGVGLVMNFK